MCGALGGVAVMLWYSGNLRFMLASKFFIWVFLGGVTLLALVLVRAVAVWHSVDANPSPDTSTLRSRSRTFDGRTITATAIC